MKNLIKKWWFVYHCQDELSRSMIDFIILTGAAFALALMFCGLMLLIAII